jgi:hypothetical protein
MRDAALAGNFAYISEGPNFKVLDISNPLQPTLVGKLLLGDLINRIVVSGTVAWVANSQKGLVAVDISNPAAPQVRGSLPFPGPASSPWTGTWFTSLANTLTTPFIRTFG